MSRREPQWSWLYSIGTFVVVGVVVFFNPRAPFFHTLGLHLVETVVAATASGLIAGALGNYGRT